MAWWRSKAIILKSAALAVLATGCSKSTPDDSRASATPDAMSAVKGGPVTVSAPKSALGGSGPAVLQATVPLPDGGSCAGTVDRDCQECLLRQCDRKAAVDACDSLTGNATVGPATGKPRSRLCREAMDCIRRTKCHANSLVDCYCGGIDLGTCNATTVDAKGVCKNELDRALEVRPGSAGSAALDVITDPSVAGGAAGIVATCENTGCASVCIPYQATSCL